MQRNLDLIRQIAFKIEESTSGLNSEEIVIKGYNAHQIGYHCEPMYDSNLFAAIKSTTLSST